VAPELADPEHNPEVLQSRLSLGAALYQSDQEWSADRMPMSYLRPAEVKAVWSRYAPTPTQTPTPGPDAVPERQISAAPSTDAPGTVSGLHGTGQPPRRTPTRRPRRRGTPRPDSAFGIPAMTTPTPGSPPPPPPTGTP
jgi:hypothetical protein